MKKYKIKRKVIQLAALILTISGLILNQSITTTVLLVVTLIGGAYYCGYICPFGFLQDIMSEFGRKLGIKKYRMPKLLDKVLSLSRYIIFVLVIFSGSALVFQLLGYDAKSNFTQLLTGNTISYIALGVLAIFSIISLFFERAFCKYFCYTGAQYGLLSLTRVFTVKRSEDTCVDCKKCDKVCPMQIQVSIKEQVRSPQCINCFECIHVCPKEDTLTYGLMKFKLGNKKKKIAVAIIASLIVIVLIKVAIPDGDGRSHGAGRTHADSQNSTSSLVNESTNTTISKEMSSIVNGTYEGVGEGFKGEVKVSVTVKDTKITDVKVISHNDDFFWFYRANSSIPSQIMETQSTDVDLVSGATYSSAGIQAAVIDALNNSEK